MKCRMWKDADGNEHRAELHGPARPGEPVYLCTYTNGGLSGSVFGHEAIRWWREAVDRKGSENE